MFQCVPGAQLIPSGLCLLDSEAEVIYWCGMISLVLLLLTYLI